MNSYLKTPEVTSEQVGIYFFRRKGRRKKSPKGFFKNKIELLL